MRTPKPTAPHLPTPPQQGVPEIGGVIQIGIIVVRDADGQIIHRSTQPGQMQVSSPDVFNVEDIEGLYHLQIALLDAAASIGRTMVEKSRELADTGAPERVVRIQAYPAGVIR